MTPEQGIPYYRMTGLRPEVWLSVGAGFNREEIKSLVLTQGRGFIAEAIITQQELCQKLTGIASNRLLPASARQEIFRMLLAEPRVLSQLSEVKRLKRRSGFIRDLDSSLQAGRMTFAHSQEAEALEDRLSQTLGTRSIRPELKILSEAFDVWCEVSSFRDIPLLIRAAIEVLRAGWPESLSKPEEIWCLSIQEPESLEREFWDVLGQHVRVKFVKSLAASHTEKSTVFDWQQWHTLDDAAEYLADQIQKESTLDDLRHHGVLIPDVPAIRRSLRRALEKRGLPLADPRDPTRLKWDESLKWALLPLEVVSRNFERQKVISWLRNFQMQDEFPAWVTEINSRGLRSGLPSYAGGMLEGVHSRLNELSTEFSPRKTCEELAESHLKYLRASAATQSERIWLLSFLEQTWKVFQADMIRVGLKEKKAPLRFWLERLQTRLSEASPPIDRLKPRTGLQLYRLQQAPVTPTRQVWIFGLPSGWLNGKGVGDYWFSERERDVLGLEFAVRSSQQIRDERTQVLVSWLSQADNVVFLEAQYSFDGRETESILPILQELETSLGTSLAIQPREMGSHPRFVQSYQVQRPVQPQEIHLPPLSNFVPQPIELTATAIERYSRCSFQALAFHRWNLRDIREPDSELWPDIRGNILHEAVRSLLENRDAEGKFWISPQEALFHAWKVKRPKGLLKSQRIESYVQSRMLKTLEAFCEKEREYVERSSSIPLVLDEMSLTLHYPDFSIRGQPDRVDQFQDGLFIMDYKTAGSVPHGSEMLEEGYRLQLPFYALAAQQKFKKPALGIQFVELDKKGSRRSGIFFKEYNGKGPGKLTQVRSNSKSLVSVSPQEAWSVLEDHLVQDARALIAGRFMAKPKISKTEKECQNCSLGDLCGYRRRSDSQSSEGEAPHD
jgi:hypothetical protein